MPFFQKYAEYILAIILCTAAALSIGAMKDDTATFDERAHVPAAYSYVRYGDMRLNPEHPPLLKDLAGLPLLFLDLKFPVESDLWTNGITKEWQFGTAMWSTWHIGSEFLYHSGNSAESILFWSRLPMVLLMVLLGIFVYRFTKEIAGPAAGLFAALIYAFDPNILAHDHYMTTDLGIAAFIFIAMYYFVRFLKNSSWKNLVFASIALGLAQLAKFSAILLFPLFGLLIFLFSITKQVPEEHSSAPIQFRCKLFGKLLWQYIVMVGLTFLIIYIGYVINTWNMPAEKTMLHANLVYAGDAPAKVFARDLINATVSIPGLAPFAHYILGVAMVFSRVGGGNSFYFMGQLPEHALKSYFPMVFLMKETLPFLFLLFLAIVFDIARGTRTIKRNTISLWTLFARSFQSNIAQYSMLSFVALYTFLSIFGNLNIGLRHIFPILPFLYSLTAIGIFLFIDRNRHTHPFSCINIPTRYLSLSLLGILSIWIILIPFFSYPNYLPYFNEVVGGSKNGHHYAVDSNYDWGQNLKRTKLWVDKYNQCITLSSGTYRDTLQKSCEFITENGTLPTSTPIDNLHIDYYGGSEVSYYFQPGTYTEWHSGAKPEPGWYAISATFFEENTHKPLKSGETDYSWLLKYQPIAQPGESILVFYVSPESL